MCSSDRTYDVIRRRRREQRRPQLQGRRLDRGRSTDQGRATRAAPDDGEVHGKLQNHPLHELDLKGKLSKHFVFLLWSHFGHRSEKNL